MQMYLRGKAQNHRENGTSFGNLWRKRTVAPPRSHYRNSTFMIAVIGIMVEQLVKMRGSSERDDNQEVTNEHANECVLPAFGAAKARHVRLF